MVVEAGYPQSGGDRVLTQNKYNLWPGTPAPSIFVLDNLLKLMNSPANRLPPAP